RIKLSNIACEDCYEDIEILNSGLDVQVDGYDCSTDELSVTISGGSGNYEIEVDNVPWVPPATIDLASGAHIISVFDTITECEIEEPFNVDCCTVFAIDAPDATVCGTSMTTYDFS